MELNWGVSGIELNSPKFICVTLHNPIISLLVSLPIGVELELFLSYQLSPCQALLRCLGFYVKYLQCESRDEKYVSMLETMKQNAASSLSKH
jgi:hypothetical protein